MSALYRICAPHFTAGLVTEGEAVATAAPIIAYMRGRSLAWVEDYCRRKRWELERCGDDTHEKQTD